MKKKETEETRSIIKDVMYKQMVLISTAICFILLLFLTAMLLFSNILEDIDIYNTNVVEYGSSVQLNNVNTAIEDFELEILPSLKNLTTRIENQIIERFDLEVLKEEISSGNIPSELEEIFSNNIRGAYLAGEDNNIFICSKNGIIADYDISNASSINNERDWEYEIERQYNREMAENTIKNILSQNTSVLLTFEKDKSTDENHKYYTELTEDTLKELISNEGVCALKNYTFLLPLYITEDGDIFGTKDIKNGHIQENHKLIVIQEYSLYNYIVENNYVDTESIESINFQYMQIISYFKIFGISIIISIICSIIFVCILSNKFYELSQQKSKARNGETMSMFGRRDYDKRIDELLMKGLEYTNKNTCGDDEEKLE